MKIFLVKVFEKTNETVSKIDRNQNPIASVMNLQYTLVAIRYLGVASENI